MKPTAMSSMNSDSDRTTKRFLGSFIVSVLVGIALLGALIYTGGVWNILANTRILVLLMDAGIVSYTDVEAGFIEGVPNHEYYLKSQDPVSWPVVLVVIGIFLTFFLIKAIQFHGLAQHYGIKGTFGQHARMYMYGQAYEKVMPFQIGKTAAVAALHRAGASLPQSYAVLFAFGLFVIFEIVVFALFGLFGLGWSAWLMQMFWALVILGVCFLWTRPGKQVRQNQSGPSFIAAVRAHLASLTQHPLRLSRLGLLSLIAFGLEDVAAYFVAMAFTSSNVILNVDFSLLLMGVVGSYIARSIRLTPGGIGQFEWGFATALYIGGLGWPEAVTIAILDNVFRYASFGLAFVAVVAWRGIRTSFQDIKGILYDPLTPPPTPAMAQGIPGGNTGTINARAVGDLPTGMNAQPIEARVQPPTADPNAAEPNIVQRAPTGTSESSSPLQAGTQYDAATIQRMVTQVPTGPSTETNGTPEVPDVDVDTHTATAATPTPYMPRPIEIWPRTLLALALFNLFLLDRFTVLLADYWIMESLQLTSVFWTNFTTGALLFAAAFLLFGSVVAIPAFAHRLSRTARWIVLSIAVQAGMFAGYQFSQQYLTFLVFNSPPIGQTDPIFGIDLSFYMFTLPATSVAWQALLWACVSLLVASVVCAYASHREQQRTARGNRMVAWLGVVSTPCTIVALIGTGLMASLLVWLSRFGLLYKDNSDSAIPTGAEYLDVAGFFSTLNAIYITAALIVGATILLAVILHQLRRAVTRQDGAIWTPVMRGLSVALVTLIVLDFAFAGVVFARDMILVRPNEPVVQLDYMQRHIDATRAAYDLNGIEMVDFVPNEQAAELPEADELVSSPVVRNAPIWPAYSSYLERQIDPAYAQRVLQTQGDTMIYGPTLEIFQQQQKLRTYYNFLDVDPLRFSIDGETQVFVSGVREIPLLEPKPWLTWWGQRFLLFTHGFGMAMAPIGETTADGAPQFVASDIPVRTDIPELAVNNQQVYYGEGAVTMAFSNIRNLEEFDYPTDQGRAVNTLPEDANIGVPLDSLVKRLVFGWRSGQFFEFVFSDLITDETKLQYYRTPLDRLERVAPFLYFDTNIYAAPVDGEIEWLVNGIAYTDMYPYSKHETLGDKSVSRSPLPQSVVSANYMEDAVKATVNAHSGEIKLYRISDDPVIRTWAGIYPELFANAETMPEGVRQQLTYPLQMFHTQFDDVFIVYQMDDPVYFFNMEDMWDDGDEVLGPILDSGGAIDFSIEPYMTLLETGGLLPESTSGTQFVTMAVFTPENALNLRAIPMVYQDGEDYGRMVVLRIPKGTYVQGPEQADAAIDQDPAISQQISWWNRRGTEVIRGHTSALVVGNELLYVEPIFLRSQQNPITQLKRVVVVFRGQPYMGETLDEALRSALSETPNQVAQSDQ